MWWYFGNAVLLLVIGLALWVLCRGGKGMEE